MIETREIRVDYADVTAVADLTVTVGEGEVYGLIGPNGAGKTSLIRVLATLREPTYGDVRIAGRDLLTDLAGARRVIGYMPDMAPVYKDLTCWEFLDLFARAYSVSRTERRRRIDACIDLVNLESKRHAIAGTLSRGMTQRLVLAKTLLHDPEVLLLDEPASGLDPIARVDLRNLLRRLRDERKTVLISSHILNELEGFCTSMGIMEGGRLVLDGSIESILASLNTHRRFTVETIGPGQAAADLLSGRASIDAIQASNGRCEFEAFIDDEQAAQLLALLIREGVAVKAFYERRRGVEEVLMEVGVTEVS